MGPSCAAAPVQQSAGHVKRLTRLPGSGELYGSVALAFAGGIRAVEGVKMTTKLLSKSVPKVDIDQRSREARLRIERIDRLLVSRATMTHSRLRSLRARPHQLSPCAKAADCSAPACFG